MACDFTTLAGSKILIGTGATMVDCDTALTTTEYETLTFTAIGAVETATPSGQSWDIATFKPLAGGEGKAKTSRQYGTFDMSIATVAGDSGQTLLKTAEESLSNYAIKYVRGDGTIHYTQGLVTEVSVPGGAQGDISMSNVKVELTQPIIEG